MKSRFEPAVLDRWKLDREYLRFLASYETFLPLAEPSNLASRELAPTIYGMAGDTIGGTVRLLKNAAAHALRTGREKIDAGVLASMNHVRSGQWDEAAQRA
jgi:AAA+ superfamily predicted ATPase